MIDVKHIPDALKEGENWQLLDIDPEWVWLAHHNGQVIGMLVAAPCHGLVFIWRVKMLPSAPNTALLSLFRRFIRDIRRRGCLGYLATVDLGRVEEVGLARIACRAKALFASSCVSVLAGTVNTGHLGKGE